MTWCHCENLQLQKCDLWFPSVKMSLQVPLTLALWESRRGPTVRIIWHRHSRSSAMSRSGVFFFFSRSCWIHLWRMPSWSISSLPSSPAIMHNPNIPRINTYFVTTGFQTLQLVLSTLNLSSVLVFSLPVKSWKRLPHDISNTFATYGYLSMIQTAEHTMAALTMLRQVSNVHCKQDRKPHEKQLFGSPLSWSITSRRQKQCNHFHIQNHLITFEIIKQCLLYEGNRKLKNKHKTNNGRIVNWPMNLMFPSIFSLARRYCSFSSSVSGPSFLSNAEIKNTQWTMSLITVSYTHLTLPTMAVV